MKNNIYFYFRYALIPPNGNSLSSKKIIHRSKELIGVINNNSKLIIIPMGPDKFLFKVDTNVLMPVKFITAVINH